MSSSVLLHHLLLTVAAAAGLILAVLTDTIALQQNGAFLIREIWFIFYMRLGSAQPLSQHISSLFAVVTIALHILSLLLSFIEMGIEVTERYT